MNNRDRKLKTVKGHIKELLAEHGDFKSVKSFRNELYKTDNTNYTDEQIHKMLLEHHNDAVEAIQESKRQEKLKKERQIKEAKKNEKRFNKFIQNVQVSPYNEKLKPSSRDASRFKNFNYEVQYDVPDELYGFESLRVFKYSIPHLFEMLEKMKGMKVLYTMNIVYYKVIDETKDEVIKEYLDFPHVSKPQIILNKTEIRPYIDELIDYVKKFIESIELKGSGWVFDRVSYIIESTMKYNPLKIKSYLPLPPEIQNKNCCINIKNEDDKCLKYCVLYHINKDKITKDPQRVTKYKPYEKDFDWSGIKFPVSIQDIEKVEKLIDYGINVYDCDKRPLRITK